MDAKDLHIPDTKDAEQLRLFAITLRDLLMETKEANEKTISNLQIELEGARVLADAAIQRLDEYDTILSTLKNKRLYDYKTKKYFDIL